MYIPYKGTFKYYITHRGREVYGPCDNSVTGEGGQMALVTIFLVTTKKSSSEIYVRLGKICLFQQITK